MIRHALAALTLAVALHPLPALAEGPGWGKNTAADEWHAVYFKDPNGQLRTLWCHKDSLTGKDHQTANDAPLFEFTAATDNLVEGASNYEARPTVFTLTLDAPPPSAYTMAVGGYGILKDSFDWSWTGRVSKKGSSFFTKPLAQNRGKDGSVKTYSGATMGEVNWNSFPEKQRPAAQTDFGWGRGDRYKPESFRVVVEAPKGEAAEASSPMDSLPGGVQSPSLGFYYHPQAKDERWTVAHRMVLPIEFFFETAGIGDGQLLNMPDDVGKEADLKNWKYVAAHVNAKREALREKATAHLSQKEAPGDRFTEFEARFLRAYVDYGLIETDWDKQLSEARKSPATLALFVAKWRAVVRSEMENYLTESGKLAKGAPSEFRDSLKSLRARAHTSSEAPIPAVTPAPVAAATVTTQKNDPTTGAPATGTPPTGAPAPTPLTEAELKRLPAKDRGLYQRTVEDSNATIAAKREAIDTARAALQNMEGYTRPKNAQEFKALKNDTQKRMACDEAASSGSGAAAPDVVSSPMKQGEGSQTAQGAVGMMAGQTGHDHAAVSAAPLAPGSALAESCAVFLAGDFDKAAPPVTFNSSAPPPPPATGPNDKNQSNFAVDPKDPNKKDSEHKDSSEEKGSEKDSWRHMKTGAFGALAGLAVGFAFGPVGMLIGAAVGFALVWGASKMISKD